MNPAVGLDVAKGECQVQLFLYKKTPYKLPALQENKKQSVKEFINSL